MTIMSIDHVQLAMPAGREDDARAFYHGILGIPEVPKPAKLAARGGCWFKNGTIKLHLGVDKDFTPARKAHPAFLVQNLQELAARLANAGCKITADDRLEGYHRFYVNDPFGNRIEFMEQSLSA